MALDLKRCPKCLTGTVAVIAFITDPKIVLKILSHLHLPTDMPTPSPARRSPLRDDLCFDSVDDSAYSEAPWEIIERDLDPPTRAPP